MNGNLIHEYFKIKKSEAQASDFFITYNLKSLFYTNHILPEELNHYLITFYNSVIYQKVLL